MYRLMLICIIACVAFSCQGGGDVKDAGTDVQEDGPCGVGGMIQEWCADGLHQWIGINPDCSEDRGEVYCYVGCDDAGVDCLPFP